MAERNYSQYSYDAMSNKVLQVDRRFVSRPSDDSTGNLESLAGKVRLADMGTRVARDSVPSSSKTKNKAVIDDDASTKKSRKPKIRGEFLSVLEATDAIEGLRYVPKTLETRQTFELILSWAQELLGDVSHDIVRSAADAALEITKSVELKDYDKKKEVEGIFGLTFSNEKFNQLMNLSRKITDYASVEDDDGQQSTEAIEDEAGVAVVFDDEDEDEEESSESESEGEDEDEESSEAAEIDIEGEDGDITIQAGHTSLSKGQNVDKDVIPVHTIDAFWLQRQISNIYSDPHTTQTKASTVMDILEASSSLRQVENDLMETFNFDHFELVTLLCKNRSRIVWCTRFARANDAKSRSEVENDMSVAGENALLKELKGEVSAALSAGTVIDDANNDIEISDVTTRRQPRLVDIDALAFDQGNHLLSINKVKLSEGSFKRTKKQYEEIHVPPPKPNTDLNEKLVPISELPEWAQGAFSDSKSLNRVQSKLYPVAFQDDENLLLCAPTGAGKTNVALLTILRTLSQFRDPNTGKLSLDDFKIVYIAPLKALVQEQVREFGNKLKQFGLKVSELTGDSQLTKEQISQTQMIVTTPEKWDIVTRKATDISYTNLVRLIIIDEIHLLHDERGPVIESIVARTLRRMENANSEPVRLVGLSATLPNYIDVATFLRVDPKQGLFFFDSSFRPCPLGQQFVGITEKKAIKRYQAMNDAAYDKVMENAGKHQVLIFVHSRKECAKTARFIRDKAIEEETITSILKTDAASREVLRTESESVNDPELKDLLSYGFGVHHAGLTRADRSSAEDLFFHGYIQVLVCTATLAWGVNLPAHTVIIKGTQIYSPEKGKWAELSPQDVLQMLGRAGRPKFDVSGEGIIITAHSELQYYLSLMNQQLPIESQFMSKLADNLNAEVVLGTVRTIDEAVEWLGYTYLYVRMLRAPALYHVGAEYADDEALLQKRLDLSHSAAVLLEKCNLLRYDKKSGKLQATELGRIASHYYISHTSIAIYIQHLKPVLSPIELFRIFSLSEEFKYIPVRHEEKLELAKLLERVPIPIKETVEEPSSKINVLLQAYISRLKLEGFALMADMVYVTQSAGRLLRAIFEICLRRGWAQAGKLALDLCKMVEKRMWLSSSPFRQFSNCPPEVIKKTEASQMPWSKYFELTDPGEVGQAIKVERAGKLVYNMLQQFPRVELEAHVQPITRSLLRVELTVRPIFEWNPAIHGNSETFWVIAEDCDGEVVYFHDVLVIRKEYADEDHIVDFTVPISEPVPPNYFITVISDRWLHSETKLAVSFRHLILPEKFPAHTALLDLQPLPVSALKDPELIDLYSSFTLFNKIQSQVFQTLFNSDDNVFVGAPSGSGKTVAAEFALFRYWSDNENLGRAVYLAPFQDLVDERYLDWGNKLSSVANGKRINKLTGELTTDLKLLEQSDLVLATPTQWDMISRRWQQRRNVQTVGLFIADDLHLLGGQNGPVYEIVLSRMRYIAAQTESSLRIVALSVCLSNGRDLGEWIGASNNSIFNFAPKDRPFPVEIHLQGYSIPHFASLMIAMAKPVYLAITQLGENKPAIVFTHSRQQCIDTSLELIHMADADGNEDSFRKIGIDVLSPHLESISDEILRDSVSHGIGYIYESMNASDKVIVEKLFESGAIQVILAAKDAVWSLRVKAFLVVVMGTQYFEGREHRYVDYPISDILKMLGRASRPGVDRLGRTVIMTPASKREYYKKFLNEALPVESHLNLFLHDAFVSEISARVISSQQDAVDWLTFSYFYRRLLANPSFYGVLDVSHQGLSEYLSDLVEGTLKDLDEAKMVEIDEEEDEISPLNNAMIAAYYNISFITIQAFALSLNSKTKLKGVLEIVTAAAEFEIVPIRRHEYAYLKRLYDRLPIKMATANETNESTHFKSFVLLQAHFSRVHLPVDLLSDQKIVLQKVLGLLAACVDVLSSNGHLNAMTAMDISQMVIQSVWDRDSPLKQIPNFTNEVIERCTQSEVESVFDVMMLDDEPRNQLLQMNPRQLSEVARFVNKYPNIDMSYQVENADEIVAGEPAYVTVTLEREIDEESLDLMVYAPRYPFPKSENWWLVVGEAGSKQLLAIKRITIPKSIQKTRLEFVVPVPGKHKLSVWCMSDSYVDVDKEIEFEVEVAEGEEEEEEEEEGDEEDKMEE
ncbi:Sec63 Brl domain-containing protein [Lipomyces japonicus]|uniref:Sec63 Brl domain-containing protein n=1 Tax=Lipomyces japonicus TaxID=56871 RepID=UPI0034CD785C